MTGHKETRFNGMVCDPPDEIEPDYYCVFCGSPGAEHEADTGECTECDECPGYEPSDDLVITEAPDLDNDYERENS